MLPITLPGIPDTHQKRVQEIIASALRSVDPEIAVRRGMMAIKADPNNFLTTKNAIRLIAVGKASIAMTAGLLQFSQLPIRAGVVVTKSQFKDKSDSFPPQIQLLTGGHPIPDESSQEAGKAIHQLLLNKSSDEIVIALISGGASALVVYPEKDVTLADYRKLTQLLLSCGATIGEINCLRKHIDGFKGGGLLRWAAPSPIISLILSDVVNNPLDVIASGPTVPDPTTFQDARKIIEKYDLSLKIPVSIHNLIDQGINKDIQETVKPDDPINNNSLIHLIGSNQIAAEAAQKAAKENGILARILTTSLVGEAGIAGEWLVEMLKKEINSGVQRPFCLIAGGETVVTLKGNGSGGRNLETALAAVRGLDGLSNVALITLATDGEDGPTDAAGAIVTGMTLASSLKNGINPDEYLKNNDSYHFWLNTGGMLQIGSTGTNVNDLAFLFAF